MGRVPGDLLRLGGMQGWGKEAKELQANQSRVEVACAVGEQGFGREGARRGPIGLRIGHKGGVPAVALDDLPHEPPATAGCEEPVQPTLRWRSP